MAVCFSGFYLFTYLFIFGLVGEFYFMGFGDKKGNILMTSLNNFRNCCKMRTIQIFWLNVYFLWGFWEALEQHGQSSVSIFFYLCGWFSKKICPLIYYLFMGKMSKKINFVHWFTSDHDKYFTWFFMLCSLAIECNEFLGWWICSHGPLPMIGCLREQ